jgi:hypothetical protein
MKCEDCEKDIKQKTININRGRHNRECDFTLAEIAYKGRLNIYHIIIIKKIQI